MFLWKPIWHKRTKMLYGDEMFLATIFFNHASPIRRVLYIWLDTFDCLMQQFCITVSKYGGLYSTFYYMCSTQYFVENPRPTSAKMKMTRYFEKQTFGSIEKCQTMHEPVSTRPCFRLRPQPEPSTLYS